MNLRHLKIFLAVCECGCNLSRAAERLYTTQPSVSLAIHEMEEHCGVLLFDRLGKKLYLTPAGERFREYAQRIVSLMDDMERDMLSFSESGTIRIGGSVTVGSQMMPELISAFQRRHPKAKVTVVIEPSRYLEEKLLRDDIDAAIVERPLTCPSIITREVKEEELAVFAPGKGPFYAGERVGQEKFCRQAFLLREKGSGTRDIFDECMKAAGYEIQPIWESQSFLALISAVRRGMGITVLPESVAGEWEERGEVLRICPEGLRFPQKFYLALHRDKVVRGLLEEFVSLAEKL